MGILDRLGMGRQHGLLSSSTAGLLSPYQVQPPMQPVVYGDIFGEDVIENLPVTRELAITVPAVSKARNLLVSSIAKLPLRALRGKAVLPDQEQPAFLYRTNGNVTPYNRMAWTVDDLIFHGFAVWVLERGTADSGGRKPILDAEWFPARDVRITNGQIMLDEQAVAAEDIILFDHPFEGLLNVAARTVRGARDTEVAWVGRMRNPLPLVDLHQTDDQLTEDEVKAYVKAWSEARRAKDGAIGSTPSSIELRVLGEVKHELFVEGRNAVRTDIGSFLNVRASMLDGTIGVDSLTYTTKDGERNLFYEVDLPFWLDPIEARLSMDDVVPRGQRVSFDMSEAFHGPTPTGPTEQD